jgi:hypothetical protein
MHDFLFLNLVHLPSAMEDNSTDPGRLERILTIVYVVQNSQNFSGLFPKNTTFRKLDLFPSSGEGGGEDTYSVGPLSPSPEDGNRSSFRNVVFFFWNTGRCNTDPVIIWW